MTWGSWLAGAKHITTYLMAIAGHVWWQWEFGYLQRLWLWFLRFFGGISINQPNSFIMFHHVSSAENIGQQPIYPSINGTFNQMSSNIYVISYHKSIISMDSMDWWPGNIDNGGSTTRNSGHRPGPDFTHPTELLVLDTKSCIFCFFILSRIFLLVIAILIPLSGFLK